MLRTALFIISLLLTIQISSAQDTWIRVNQLWYKPEAKKVAVWVSKRDQPVREFLLRDIHTQAVAVRGKASKAFGAYVPFVQSYRLAFSSFRQPGEYIVEPDEIQPRVVRIG